MPAETPAALLIKLLDELARARGRTTTAFAESRLQHGLSELDAVVFNAITGAASPPTVPQIGRSLGHARQVIQRAATALVERGLAQWVANPDHKRAHRLLPTEAGLALKRGADAHGLAIATRLTEGMDVAVLKQAVSALHAVREQLEANLRKDLEAKRGLAAD